MTPPENDAIIPGVASAPGIRSLKMVFAPWIPAVCGMAAIFYVSSLPGKDIFLPEFNFSDKVFHSLAYGLLGGLIHWRLGLRRLFPIGPGRKFGPGIPEPYPTRFDWRGVLIGVAYGASDEIHQYFVPTRECDIFDWMADSLGVICGVLIMLKLTRAWIRRRG